MSELSHVLQFEILLIGSDPLIWRRIQVPEETTFWGLHVAIQDAMGWLDCHLHHFELLDPKEGTKVYLGIPEEAGDYDPLDTQPDWEYNVRLYLQVNPSFTYEYDYGDGWCHQVTFEGRQPKDPSQTYPRCLDGARACPPEDVGGVWGYEEFLQAIQDPRHEGHEALLEWVGGAFDPEAFDPKAVEFDDPELRWKLAFEEAVEL